MTARISIVTLLLLAGCEPGTNTCMALGPAAGLWTRAQRVRVDVYADPARCDGDALVDAAGTLLMSRVFDPDEALELDVAAGHRTFVVTLYSDLAASVPFANACSEANLANTPRGACLTLDLQLLPGIDLAGTDDDAGMVAPCDGQVCPCDPANDSCAAGSYCLAGACVPGCKASAECAAVPDAGSGAACCDHQCVDVNRDPANCGACGIACSAPTSECGVGACRPPCTASCGATCCRNVHGVCGADCALACDAGFGDCDGDPSNGCEQSLFDVRHCGSCTNACQFPSGIAACPNGSCLLMGCAAGRLDCNGSASDGCECAGTDCCGSGCQTAHSNGTGQKWATTFYDCVALNTYNQTQAQEACDAFTQDDSQCHATTCSGSNHAVCSDGSTTSCTCWIYSGSNIGRVRSNGAGSCSCNGNTAAWD